MHRNQLHPSPPPRPNASKHTHSLSRKAHSLTKRHSLPRHARRPQEQLENVEELTSMYQSCHEHTSKHADGPSKIKYYLRGKQSPKGQKGRSKSSRHRQSKVKSN